MSRQNVITRAKKKRAFALMRARQWEEARALYAEVCKTDKQDADAWFSLGAINGMLGRHAEASECPEPSKHEAQPRDPGGASHAANPINSSRAAKMSLSIGWVFALRWMLVSLLRQRPVVAIKQLTARLDQRSA